LGYGVRNYAAQVRELNKLGKWENEFNRIHKRSAKSNFYRAVSRRTKTYGTCTYT